MTKKYRNKVREGMKGYRRNETDRVAVLHMLRGLMWNCPDDWPAYDFQFRYKVLKAIVKAHHWNKRKWEKEQIAKAAQRELHYQSMRKGETHAQP